VPFSASGRAVSNCYRDRAASGGNLGELAHFAAMGLANTAFLDACAGRRPERTPVWMMRQAGRYLPEYRAIRKEVSFLELCHTPQLCAEVTLQPIDRFGLDAAILFSDILVVFEAMGVDVEFNPGPQVANPVRNAADVARLRWGDPAQEISFVMDAVRACKSALADRIPLIGFCGAPFTTLSYLIEGKGSRDFENVKGMIFSDPVLFGGLMEKMTDLLAKYLAAQIDAGADAVQIFDSWAGALSPRDYAEHVLPHTRELVSRVRAHDKPVILFARGNANLLATSASIPSDVVGIDWSIGMKEAIEVVGSDRVVQGNLDPMLLLGSPETLVARTREVMEEGRAAKAHIFNLGHGISRHSDPEMAKLMIDTVHAG
jgi:uroporphyrinogen decarboxylase